MIAKLLAEEPWYILYPSKFVSVDPSSFVVGGVQESSVDPDVDVFVGPTFTVTDLEMPPPGPVHVNRYRVLVVRGPTCSAPLALVLVVQPPTALHESASVVVQRIVVIELFSSTIVASAFRFSVGLALAAASALALAAASALALAAASALALAAASALALAAASALALAAASALALAAASALALAA